MSGRELLEMAAKAAGIKLMPHPNAKIIRSLMFLSGGKPWNPLTDDGDALRLAVKTGVLVRYVAHSGDQMAATRRAIVRAAAEIGKAMP